ncbi:MAG: ATP-grasp domain-containing protein [Candidatus Competibacterales bacterium]|nr:ATP-grasp domain-containing protein [Candidatus Competibacterales bacterium]
MLGLDEVHAQNLRTIPDADRFRFHELLHADEIVYLEEYDIDAKLDEARRILDKADGTIDAVIGHWDFPVTSMVPILCREYSLISPTLTSVLTCTHKYWSRLEQQKAAPEATPKFCAVDPFDDRAPDRIELDYPFWIKPVKGYASILGFYIAGREDLDKALAQARQEIRRLGEPFTRFLERVERPREIHEVDGNHMIAEEIIGGRELAPEGYVQNGQFHAHGMIDMVRGRNRKSFQRYQYPSRMPRRVQERAVEISRKVLQQIGFDNGCFNIEFFWDEGRDRLSIIEINPRASQSHADLFRKVDGMSNHDVAVHVALGEDPRFERGGGRFRHAAKCLYRRYDRDDAVVTHVPTQKELQKLRRRQPETVATIDLKKGMRLSELKDQDPYSYVLAELSIGAMSRKELLAKFREAQELLPFEFEPVND